MAKRHVLGEVFLRNPLLHLQLPVLHAADVAIDDSDVVFLANVLVALRMGQRVLHLHPLEKATACTRNATRRRTAWASCFCRLSSLVVFQGLSGFSPTAPRSAARYGHRCVRSTGTSLASRQCCSF